MPHPFLWYRDRDLLGIGGVNRYVIRYLRLDHNHTHVYMRLKNFENAPIRAIHLLNGPFTLYCHVVPYRYNCQEQFHPEDSDINKEVVFRNEVKPGQTFNVKLSLNDNSYVETVDGADVFQWEVDVVSQIVVTRNTSIEYDFMIGNDMERMKRTNRTALHNALTSWATSSPSVDGGRVGQTRGAKTGGDGGDEDADTGVKADKSVNAKTGFNAREPVIPTNNNSGATDNPQLSVTKSTTEDLWSRPAPRPDLPVHLVVVTHGLFSNLTADMLYLKDSIEATGTNVMVRGYSGNAGRTERGVKRLGVAMGEYLVTLFDDLKRQNAGIAKVSFIAHSLGGLIQLYAIKHVLATRGHDFFAAHGVEPYSLICMASPLLGILSETSFMISWFLDVGTLGKTGRDLTLLKKIPNLLLLKHHDEKNAFKPVLEVLPDDPLQTFLAQFKHLCVYANAINDGIVPLRTSALLYLDWQALGDVTEITGATPEVAEAAANSDKSDADKNDADKSGGTDAVKSQVAQNGDAVKADKTHADNHADSLDADKTHADNHADNHADSFDADSFHADNHDTPSHSPSLRTNRTVESVGEVPDVEKPKPKTFLGLHWGRHKKRGLTKKERKFLLISARGVDSAEVSDVSELSADTNDDGETDAGTDATDSDNIYPSLNIPPKASAVELALSTVFCPIPSNNYIMDPELRRPVIFHDKYYHFENLPKNSDVASKKSSVRKILFNYNDWKIEKQVRIAKKYHTSKLNWRKVLVNLPPDAHNNIVVRRRFVNGYGWGVVDHLCKHFFVEEEEDDNGTDVSVRAKM